MSGFGGRLGVWYAANIAVSELGELPVPQASELSIV